MALTTLSSSPPVPNSPPSPFSRIVGTSDSCHNYQALATKRRCGVSFYPASPTLPHDIFYKDFSAHQEPASERTRRIPVVRLRPPPFPRAGVLFAARSFDEQRLDPDWIACCPQLDRHPGSLSFRSGPAILGSRIIPAAHLHVHAGHALVPLATRAISNCQDARRNLAAHVRARAARHPARALPLDGRHPDRRPSRPHRWRLLNPLPQRCGRIHCLHDGSGRLTLPHHRLLVLGHLTFGYIV